jgi:DNA-directed RNA polymerase subunit RPC12/RpoP
VRAIEAKKGLPRCSRCREFLGPADAVCVNCGQAYTPFIRVRAEKLGLSPRVCHHNFMESETGYTCVRCGLQMLAGGVRDISRLSTRVGTLCGCCGSRLRGKMFCTTCGARVGLWTVKPKLDDARAFRLFTQHAAYLERQDPNYRFKVHSSRPLNWAAALLIILAMVVAVMGVIYLASHYLWLQRSLAHVNEQYPDRSVEAAALDHFIAQGCNPVGMSSLRSDT